MGQASCFVPELLERGLDSRRAPEAIFIGPISDNRPAHTEGQLGQITFVLRQFFQILIPNRFSSTEQTVQRATGSTEFSPPRERKRVFNRIGNSQQDTMTSGSGQGR